MTKHIYTDGSCSGNPGPGGWAWIEKKAAVNNSNGGFAVATTNNRMELTAAIAAIEHNQGELVIYSDSKYVVDAIENKWLHGWSKKGWKNSSKKPVKNQDLWKRMLAALEANPNVSFVWVKGHSTDYYNQRADELAVRFCQQGINKAKKK